MDKKDLEMLKVAGVVFAVAVTSNIVGNTIYTKSRIGIDKKKLLIGTAVGLGFTYLLVKLIKK